jgi:hemerythrin-like domain-containing protein
MRGRKIPLPRDHVLATLYAEHERLLGFLEQLDACVRSIARATAPLSPADGETVTALAQTFVAAEPHHRREEEVLFPVLEGRGLYGPPRRMRFEHEELRALKARLVELSLGLTRERGFQETAKAFAGVAGSLASLLREHIRREDEVLYPVSLEEIDEATWDSMKAHCDRIGYCPFTPER